MKTDTVEDFRRHRVEHIQHKQAQRAEKLRQLRREMDELEATDTALHQEMARAQSFNASSGICPRCAIDNGVTTKLVSIPFAAIMHEEHSEEVDLWQCPLCGWDDTSTQ